VNVAGQLELVASAVGEQTRVGALVSKIAALTTRRAPIERWSIASPVASSWS